jgi:Flp pilus assembly protein CpaB
LVGEVEDGDRVDVLGAYKVEDQTGKEHDVVKAIARDILVLRAPDKPAAGGLAAGAAGADEQIVLRLDEQRAADIAFTAEYGKVWIALRPAAGAREARRPPTVTIDSLLFGVTPIPVHAAARLKHGPLLRRGNTTTGGN